MTILINKFQACFAFTKPASAILTVLLLAALFFTGCQTTDSLPAETVLRLSLNDSLSKYDSVVVTIVDRQNPSLVLENVWSGHLTTPTQLPGHTLTVAKGKDFIVRVAGYAADNQLFLETHIYFVGGKQSVVHQPVPPYQPRYRLQSLTASSGKVSPTFNLETVQYQIAIPEGITSVTLNAHATFAGAQVVIDGIVEKRGTPSQPFTIGTSPDTINIAVTDASQGAPYTRAYKVILIPTLPPPLQLASLVPSAGTLTPAFNPSIKTYTLALPASMDTVSFKMHPVDPNTMTMIFTGFSIFPGEKSRLITVAPGKSEMAYVEVHRGSDLAFYQITVNRAQ